ncbi:hypothetical protein Gotur_031237 [Gossypium turneri]
MCITGMSKQWVAARIKQKGDSKCIPWKNLRDLILAHPDVKKRVDIFTLSIYSLFIFPKALGHVGEAVIDLFDRLDKGVTQFHSHFWKVEKVSYQIFSENYSPLKELVATPRQDDITEEKWMAIFQNLQEDDVEWKARWMVPDEILYRCGDFYWIPLLGIWGAVRYTPLLIIKRDFEKRSLEWGKKIEQLEEEKMRLGLDVDIHKLEAEKLRKGKNKAEEDLDSLKTDYKKLRLSMRTASLGKTSEQWRQEIKEERTKVDSGKRNFRTPKLEKAFWKKAC